MASRSDGVKVTSADKLSFAIGFASRPLSGRCPSLCQSFLDGCVSRQADDLAQLGVLAAITFHATGWRDNGNAVGAGSSGGQTRLTALDSVFVKRPYAPLRGD